MTTVEIWHAGGFELAEGVRQVGDSLVFVDILSGRLFAAPLADRGTPALLAQVDVPLGAVAPIRDRPGEWIAAAGTGIALLDHAGALHWLARPEDGGPVATRINDGCCDPRGRFWAGSMAEDNTRGAGSLYRVDPDGTVTKVLGNLTIVNGPAFSADGATMYLADSGAGRILRYTIDASGAVHDEQVFDAVAPEDGSPDGMAVDDDGRLWVAMWGASCVRSYNPDGSLHEVINLPTPQPASVCLTADSRLFVATARYGLADADAAADADPAAGALLCVRNAAAAPEAAQFSLTT